MKLIKHFSMILCAAAFTLLVACEMAIPPFGPIDRPDNGELPPPVEAPDTIGWNIPAEAITIAQAREICMGLESGEKTDTKYYVMGYVKKIHSKHADGVTNYGNAQFYMEDVKGANSGDDFMAYQVYGVNNQKITDPNAVLVGDFVIVYGTLTNYMGTFETTGQGSAHIWKSTNPLFNEPQEPQEPEILEIPEEAKAWNIPEEAIDVIKAREICAGLASGATTDTKYYVMGYVKKLHNNHASGVSGYGNAQFYMENVKGANSQNDFIAFQVYGINGTKITDPNSVAVGDFVVVYGELTNYMGNTYETVGQGKAHIWKSTNPLMVETKPEPQEVSILDISLGENGAIKKFGVANIDPETSTWAYNRKGLCTQISGENNEDWLISPALDLAGMSEASLNFSYKFSAAIPAELQEQYTVWVSKDYDGKVENVKNATWVPLTGFSYEATSYTDSGVLSLPEDMIGGTCYVAWKYNTQEVSHTWSLKNIVVKAMTKVE